jgi:lipopolysaccharide export system protein LptC
MATYDNSYSRMVAWLKIILPLAALAILSTLFLASRSIDSARSIPFADGTIKELAREQRIGKPSFSGVTDNGTAVTIAADSARPLADGQQGFSAVGLRATLASNAGYTVEVMAKTGQFNSETRMADLGGGVRLDTSSGYRIETASLTASLENALVQTGGAITADGPLGHISAGKMVLRQQSDGDAAATYELVFKNGVKLLYLPQQ